MATLEEVDREIKAIAASINEAKASGAAKTDPATLKRLVVSNHSRHAAGRETTRCCCYPVAVRSYCTLDPNAGLVVPSAGPAVL